MEFDAANFKWRLKREVSNAACITPTRVHIISLQKGSIIAAVMIQPPAAKAVEGLQESGGSPPAAWAVVRDLVVQAGDPESALRLGYLGRNVVSAKVLALAGGGRGAEEEEEEEEIEEGEDAVVEVEREEEEEAAVEEVVEEKWGGGEMEDDGSLQDHVVDEVRDDEGLDMERLIQPGEISEILRSVGYADSTAREVEKVYSALPNPPSVGEFRSSIVPIPQPPSFRPAEATAGGGGAEVARKNRAPERSKKLVAGSEEALEKFERGIVDWRGVAAAREGTPILTRRSSVESERSDEVERLPSVREERAVEEATRVLDAGDAVKDEVDEQPAMHAVPEKDPLTAAAVKSLFKAKSRHGGELTCQVSWREFTSAEAKKERYAETEIVPPWGMFICSEGVACLARRGIVGIMAVKLEKPELAVRPQTTPILPSSAALSDEHRVLCKCMFFQGVFCCTRSASAASEPVLLTLITCVADSCSAGPGGRARPHYRPDLRRRGQPHWQRPFNGPPGVVSHHQLRGCRDFGESRGPPSRVSYEKRKCERALQGARLAQGRDGARGGPRARGDMQRRWGAAGIGVCRGRGGGVAQGRAGGARAGGRQWGWGGRGRGGAQQHGGRSGRD